MSLLAGIRKNVVWVCLISNVITPFGHVLHSAVENKNLFTLRKPHPDRPQAPNKYRKNVNF